jgi:hypothetical protein
MGHNVAENDEVIVKLTRRAHLIDEYPGLRSRRESQLFRQRMKVRGHLLGDKF